MQQKKTRRGREYLNDFRRDVNGSYLRSEEHTSELQSQN